MSKTAKTVVTVTSILIVIAGITMLVISMVSPTTPHILPIAMGLVVLGQIISLTALHISRNNSKK